MMSGLRVRLASAAGAARIPQLALALTRRQVPPSRLTVVNYHRVNEPNAVAALDTGVLDATPESLDRHLKVLRKHFTPISLDELLTHIARPGGLPPNPALITFDDGYRDNLEHAVPILKRHGVRATFFIATLYVSERRLFWWDRISWLLKNAGRQRFVLEHPRRLEIDLRAGTAHAERMLHRIVKTHCGLELDAFLTHLNAAADAGWTRAIETDLAGAHVLTWDQVRAIHRAGMDIGSHTRTHRVLQTIASSELESELALSRSQLETELGTTVHAIAYPVGRSLAGFPDVRAAVERAGYRVGFNYEPSPQSLHDLDPLDIRRFSVDRTTSDLALTSQLAFRWFLR